ncbi:MAG: ATPase domain-containing protein, partial [Pseudomonadota bacterium]|nr:ATPase domain-containing protein [Pseudomonadota bacterium]
MAKAKTLYVCTECGEDFTKWLGQCSNCGQWNTLQEFKPHAGSKARSSKTSSVSRSSSSYAGTASSVKKIKDIDLAEQPRISSGFSEFDRVLGGGIVSGSVVLLGGHPGAGKSTILLQVMNHLAQTQECLYVTGEESPQQVAARAHRLGEVSDQLSLLAETDIELILHEAQKLKPKVLVIDSIQVMQLTELSSAPGTVTQVREAAAALTRFAKQTGTAVFIVGH